ncbi:tonB dependent receptor family protein, partial [Vibrio parahaemolyticus V-223/04]
VLSGMLMRHLTNGRWARSIFTKVSALMVVQDYRATAYGTSPLLTL